MTNTMRQRKNKIWFVVGRFLAVGVFLFLLVMNTGCGSTGSSIVPLEHQLANRLEPERHFTVPPAQLWEILQKVVREDGRNFVLVCDQKDMILSWSCDVPDYDSLEWSRKATDERSKGSFMLVAVELPANVPKYPALALLNARVVPENDEAVLFIRCTTYVGMEDEGLNGVCSRGTLEQEIVNKVSESLNNVGPKHGNTNSM